MGISNSYERDTATTSDAALKQGVWQKFLFFLKHSIKNVKRHPCHFCLSSCSVLICVLSTLVINTVVSQGPIIFVSLAQIDSGEMDVSYSAETRYENDNLNLITPYRTFMNYTQVKELYAEEYNLSPRFT